MPAQRTKFGSATTYLTPPDLTPEHCAAVVARVRRIGLLAHPRLSETARIHFVVSALMADADGKGSPALVQAALSDPAVVAIARRIIADAVSS
jgi:hypothetical protein